ncbi:hypothetical protein [Mycobacterium sp. SMC-4]|uniref:hypothetical protein n=1 Tax=Mycobacterium sp. SMC-4 TaxID=2857059 RepID=UPI003D03AF43
MVDGLCEVLDEHLAAPRIGREMDHAAIGCVPWLTSAAVAQRLLKLTNFCVVVDKSPINEGAFSRAERIKRGTGIPNSAFTGLEDMVPVDDTSAPSMIGPYTDRDELPRMLDPVRVVGWNKPGQKPLLHAKLLVLGQLGWRQYDTPYGEREEFKFVPQTVWFGSANSTEAARNHLETGFVSDDPSLVQSASWFVQTVIGFSESAVTAGVVPRPDMRDLPWDDEAFAQASAELRDAYEGWDADKNDEWDADEDES